MWLLVAVLAAAVLPGQAGNATRTQTVAMLNGGLHVGFHDVVTLASLWVRVDSRAPRGAGAWPCQVPPASQLCLGSTPRGAFVASSPRARWRALTAHAGVSPCLSLSSFGSHCERVPWVSMLTLLDLVDAFVLSPEEMKWDLPVVDEGHVAMPPEAEFSFAPFVLTSSPPVGCAVGPVTETVVPVVVDWEEECVLVPAPLLAVWSDPGGAVGFTFAFQHGATTGLPWLCSLDSRLSCMRATEHKYFVFGRSFLRAYSMEVRKTPLGLPQVAFRFIGTRLAPLVSACTVNTTCTALDPETLACVDDCRYYLLQQRDPATGQCGVRVSAVVVMLIAVALMIGGEVVLTMLDSWLTHVAERNNVHQ